jgi:hypothetical protein
LLKALRFLGGRADDAVRSVDPALFARIVEDVRPVKKGSMSIGDMLSSYGAEDYAKMRTFLTPDQASGFAITPTGDLVSVFSTARGRGERLAQQATAKGARTLDNFDIQNVLPSLYGKAGFKETARYAYDPQYADELSDYVNAVKPDVVFMGLDPEVARRMALLRFAGAEDVARVVAGRSPRVSRSRAVQNAAAASAGAGAGAGALGGYLSTRD